MTVGLFANSGSGDVWNGLALTDLNMNGFSITNINTATILQTDTTGQALDVSRNLAAANTDSSIVCFYNLNAGDDQPVLTVRTASNAAAANPMVIFESTDAAFDQPVLSIIQDGPAEGVLITQNGDAYGLSVVNIAGTGINAAIFAQANGGGYGVSIEQVGDAYALYIDHSAATTNTQYGIQVLGGAGATIANFEYSGNEFIRMGMNNDANGTTWFYRNLAAVATAGPVVKIEQSHADDDMGALYVVSDSDADAANPVVLFESTNAAFDQPVLSIIQDGVGQGILLNQVGDATGLEIITSSSNSYALSIYSNQGATQGQTMMFLHIDNPLWDMNMVNLNNDGLGTTLKCDDDSPGPLATIHIDKDGNNAAEIWAIEIDCDNAGDGAAAAIDMTSFSAAEHLFGVPVDAGAIGAHYGRIAVLVTGVGTKYIDIFEAA